ncbi:circularly permuted type 2 ATP-grasp protein [Myxococcota bacterium]|nr:circularly permuted type 2 ATP-grasp protein [Myxococcota bacterium]
MRWSRQDTGYDEILAENGEPRSHYARLLELLGEIDGSELNRRERLQQLSLLNQGITFAVYGDEEGTERVFPFDFVPRIIPASEWSRLEAGLVQRVTALNLFLKDIYGERACLKEGVLPWELVLSRREYKRELLGIQPPRGVYTHIVGTDLIRDDSGEYLVLEDNCRCPSGVSYVIENRNLLQRSFPELFSAYPVHPVETYPSDLLDVLRFVAPRSDAPNPVILSPGVYNSAYFEHSFLAREMGIPLVEGSDLVVDGSHVFMRTTSGLQRVDCIYRRIDDDFLDPLVFNRDSTLGVPGLINAYRAGNVALCNAPGAGVADDKAIYAYMPELIRFYLSEDPILAQVPTYVGARPDDFAYMLDHLDELVVKTTGDAGGYGMLMGPFSTEEERASYRDEMRNNPDGYIAQNLVELSSHGTWIGEEFVPRRIDLRPFVLCGEGIQVLAGGLTRVALKEGSYVVNSSQGGGSKDTWVLTGAGG